MCTGISAQKVDVCRFDVPFRTIEVRRQGAASDPGGRADFVTTENGHFRFNVVLRAQARSILKIVAAIGPQSAFDDVVRIGGCLATDDAFAAITCNTASRNSSLVSGFTVFEYDQHLLGNLLRRIVDIRLPDFRKVRSKGRKRRKKSKMAGAG